MDHQDQKPKRRVRYKGTHPKSFKEKYKEMQPEKYADTVSKVIQKGSTPAGMHISICVNEILDFFQIHPGQQGLDATLGYGGHTLAMLKALNYNGHIHATDIDPLESSKTRERLAALGYGPEFLTIHQMNFSQIDTLVSQYGPFDFILADLGVSSMQIDNPDRGFSYKREGPLDLRLNPEQGISAAQRLRAISEEELEGMLIENADEPHAFLIAKAVVTEIKRGNTLNTTTQLKKIIERALSNLPVQGREDEIKKSCQRTFQALRIDVNNEFEVLYDFLEKLPSALKKGGKVALLAFHSGEDRLVKKSFKYFYNQGIYQAIADGPIRPSLEECQLNSRARSTKMRWAIKA